MRRGIVFHDENDELQLALLQPDGTFTEYPIGDEDKIYADMPRCKGEIVEAQQNEVIQIFSLRSLYSMNFCKDGKEVPAHEAIRHAMKDGPDALAIAISGPELQGEPQPYRSMRSARP